MSDMPPPPPSSSNDDNTMAVIAHAGGILFGFLAPLLIMLIRGGQPGFVRDQSVEALNFQITLAIGWVAAFILTFIGIGLLLYPVLWVVSLVFGIMGAMAASRGEGYRYPFALRLVK